MGTKNIGTAPLLLPQIPQELDDTLKTYLAALQLSLFRYLSESARSETGADLAEAVSGSMNFLGVGTTINGDPVTGIGESFADIVSISATSTKANLAASGGLITKHLSAGTFQGVIQIVETSSIFSGTVTTAFKTSSGASETHAMTTGGNLESQSIGSKTFKLQLKKGDSGAEDLLVDANNAWLAVLEY